MPFDTEIRFTLNGVEHRAAVGLNMSALEMLRDVIGLTGTKYGCGEGECGACTIIVDGRSVNSCLLFALDCDGRALTTIEGLASDANAEALRQAFVAHGAALRGTTCAIVRALPINRSAMSCRGSDVLNAGSPVSASNATRPSE